MTGKKILIVDDEEEILQLLERKLSHAGYQVIKAYRGREAINKAKLFIPDLILIDIMMPDMDGPEAVRLIKEEAAVQDIPVLFLSGILTKEQDNQQNPSVKISEKEYRSIPKPFDSDELLEEIKQVLQKHNTSKDSA